MWLQNRNFFSLFIDVDLAVNGLCQQSGSTMEKKLLIDVDCGVDDAQAIMMALAVPNVQILGITCVHGNTSIENVCKNVLRVLQACDRMEVRCGVVWILCTAYFWVLLGTMIWHMQCIKENKNYIFLLISNDFMLFPVFWKLNLYKFIWFVSWEIWLISWIWA